MRDDAVLVCVRVIDHPHPHVPSFGDRCRLCREPVWRSERSRGLVMAVQCVQCSVRDWSDDSVIVLAPYVEADLNGQ